MTSDTNDKKDYKAIITAKAEQSKGLRQIAFEKAGEPEDKSLQQEVELHKEQKKRMTGQG
jgi:hypothetical protein